MGERGRLIIITAPSGTGKSTVIRRFMETHPDMIHSISCTTRKTRPDKRDAGDYTFIDKETFQSWIDQGKFAEWAEYVGNFYGTPREPLDKWLEEGTFVLLDLEVVGGTELKDLYKEDAISIFLLPPNEEELKRRLSSRGTDSEEVQQERLRTALVEMTYKDKYDHRVVNDDLDRACKEIEKIIMEG
ncbi:MAG: guanylate kinase [Deltaproteobacteria bacterium]|jgi:guanylate kinase|nr:guanylate kinase [Deltaproteobacteria bacterium]